MKPFYPILAEGAVFYIGVSLGKRKQSYNEVLQSNRQTKTEQHTRLENHSGKLRVLQTTETLQTPRINIAA